MEIQHALGFCRKIEGDSPMNVMEIPEQKHTFLISLVLSAVLIGLLSLIKLAHIPVPPCYFHQLTGLYCPGCGGTRAWIALLHGHFLHSLVYHPVVLYGTFVYLVYVLSNLRALLPHMHHTRSGMAFRNIYLYLAVILILGNWILKNILLCAFHLAM